MKNKCPHCKKMVEFSACIGAKEKKWKWEVYKRFPFNLFDLMAYPIAMWCYRNKPAGSNIDFDICPKCNETIS